MKALPRGRRDRDVAWGYLVANLAVCPGVGSIMAGRRIVGSLQATMALAGFLLSLWFAYATLRDLFVMRELVMPEGRVFLAGLAGLGSFVAAWVWALATSLSILRASAGGEREEAS